MKKKCLADATLSAALITGFLLVSSAASALTWSFNDPCDGSVGCTVPVVTGPPLYYGGDGQQPSTPVAAGDLIGDPGTYDILNLTANIDSTNLTVSVLTRYVEEPGNWVKYGDLMLSTNPYAPFGSSPYPLDTKTNTGTVWNYAVSTASANIIDSPGNILTGGTGTGTIYKNPAVFMLSDSLAGANQHRSDQIVLVDTSGGNTGTNNNVTVVISHPNDIPGAIDPNDNSTGTLITYTIPLSDIELIGGVPLELSGIAVRWAMTCANDIVEAYVIPEPETLALFVSGLLSLVLFSRSKKPVGDDTLS